MVPEALLGFRLIIGDVAMLEASGRQYHVIGTGSGAGISTSTFGRELIHRGNVGLTVVVYGPHALSIGYVVSTREASALDRTDRHQAVQTVTLSYSFLSRTRFGAIEWRPSEMSGR